MPSYTGTFTAAAQVSGAILLKPGQALTYSLTESAPGTWVILFQESTSPTAHWNQVGSYIDDLTTTTLTNDSKLDKYYRLRCKSIAVVTVDYTLADATGETQHSILNPQTGVAEIIFTDQGVKIPRNLSVTGTSTLTGAATISASGVTLDSPTITTPTMNLNVKRVQNTAKIGATAGWVVGAADNLGLLATLPAAQTASTLVIPITHLNISDIITGFYLIGQIEATSGDTVTLDADLRKLTAVAGDVTDASIGAITQLSVTADTLISNANATKTLAAAETVSGLETFYILITATTGAVADVVLQAAVIAATEVHAPGD